MSHKSSQKLLLLACIGYLLIAILGGYFTTYTLNDALFCYGIALKGVFVALLLYHGRNKVFNTKAKSLVTLVAIAVLMFLADVEIFSICDSLTLPYTEPTLYKVFGFGVLTVAWCLYGIFTCI